MMYYPGKQAEEIKQRFDFLFNRNYSFRVINEHKVAFFSQKCTLTIYSERYEEGFSVVIDFSEQFPASKNYSVGLIKRVLEQNYEKHEKLDDTEYLKQISQFVEAHIDKLENEQYCNDIELEGKKRMEEALGDLKNHIYRE